LSIQQQQQKEVITQAAPPTKGEERIRILNKPLEGESYKTFINAIKCEPTRRVYTSELRGFMTFLHFSANEVDKLLMNYDIKLIQKCIIDFIIYLREERKAD
jgi:hypothetical protein